MNSRLCLIVFFIFVLAVDDATAAALKISANSTVRAGSEIEANYTTTHLFIDEIAGGAIPITIFFDPGTSGIQLAEVFTNLNRRDRAGADADGDGIHDGILPPNGNNIAAGDDSHYFKAHSMAPVSGGYQITLYADRTGAYRLTARYRLNGEGTGVYHYYNNTDGGGKRDHAIVVSPQAARDIRLYEVNTLNIEASGTLFSQRSTFEDLSDRPGALHTAGGRSNHWNLDYVKDLGVNWLWFQPYHPYGWEGRHLSAQNINDRAPGSGAATWRWSGGSPFEDVNYPYALGSPYAVKNFWEIEPRMSATFSGDPLNITDVSSQTNRDNAMSAFQNFVNDADAAGINIMPDAAFNHTAWDVELGEEGIRTTSPANPNLSWMAAQGASGWDKRDLIHDRELRVFSREGDYRLRASFYVDFFDNNIAPAPDRMDFGKWLDVCDIFFGRYAALVGAQNGSETGNYNAEGDWFDSTSHEWNGSNGGSFDAVTRATWRYFAQYAPYWLEKTRPPGQNRNSLLSDGDSETRYAWDARGIDGLRCDFGQGLPPQAWEYIINVARSHKWSFVFMAETLDGGAPPYRSNRHFDILNENILFAAKGATDKFAFQGMFETRRNAFGQGLVLLNTVSHDEDNYANPWAALARYAIFSTNDGAPMIFPGQELGISTLYGYDLMEKNFGKYIPHFKTYNSMMPLWEDTNFGLDQLYPVYSAINAARAFSPALRSSNRWFLTGNGGNDKIFASAKYEEPNASPAFKDVVLAFANLDIFNAHQDTFVLPPALATLLGIKDGRTYNVRNIAAYSAQQANRRELFQWGAGITGTNLKSTGFVIQLHEVPTVDGDWSAEPYEAKYLKLYDVTPPPAPAQPANETLQAYTIGNQVTFTWNASPSNTADDNVTSYLLVVKEVGTDNTIFSQNVGNTTTHTIGAGFGQSVYAFVVPVSAAGVEGTASAASSSVKALDPVGDEDGDGMDNAAEDMAGTSPLDPASILQVASTTRNEAGDVTIMWDSVPGKQYRVQWTDDLTVGFAGAPAQSGVISGSAAPATTTSYTDPNPGGARKFYRVMVVP